MEGFYILVGVAMLYSTAHFIIVSYLRDYASRTPYEKVVTNAGVVSITLMVLSLMLSGY